MAGRSPARSTRARPPDPPGCAVLCCAAPPQVGSSFTLFAPNDQAFEEFMEMGNITTVDLLNSPELSAYLLYHVLNDTVSGDW